MSDSRDHLEAIDQPTVHHEETDVNIRAIFGFAAGLLAVAIVIHVAAWGLFRYFDYREARIYGPASPLATGEVRLPPEPRLQVNPRQDLSDFHTQEDAILNGYTWVNRETGTVRIPSRTLVATMPKRSPKTASM